MKYGLGHVLFWHTRNIAGFSLSRRRIMYSHRLGAAISTLIPFLFAIRTRLGIGSSGGGQRYSLGGGSRYSRTSFRSSRYDRWSVAFSIGGWPIMDLWICLASFSIFFSSASFGESFNGGFGPS